jgi:hypothetical protein
VSHLSKHRAETVLMRENRERSCSITKVGRKEDLDLREDFTDESFNPGMGRLPRGRAEGERG